MALASEDSAATLVAEWIDHLPNGRPPGAVVGHVAKRIGVMLGEGIPYADVRRGLQAWQEKGLSPSLLDSVVHEIRTAQTRRPRDRNGIDWDAQMERAHQIDLQRGLA